MENVILTIHLILAMLLIGVVLLQRSEGGGLGMGSSGGTMTSRGAATALTRLTWIFAIAFIITSIALTLLAAKNSTGSSVIDQIGGTAPAPAPTLPLTVPGSDLGLPPAPATAPLTPPRVDGGAATGDAPAPGTAGN